LEFLSRPVFKTGAALVMPSMGETKHRLHEPKGELKFDGYTPDLNCSMNGQNMPFCNEFLGLALGFP
jgi:hypothetical protein